MLQYPIFVDSISKEDMLITRLKAQVVLGITPVIDVQQKQYANPPVTQEELENAERKAWFFSSSSIKKDLS